MADNQILVSFMRTQSSKLNSIPIVDGRFILCEDSCEIYIDSGTQRIPASQNIIEVDSLPLAPISKKIYVVKATQKAYIYVNGTWVCLNDIDVNSLSSDNLNTTNKTIVGAINELYEQIASIGTDVAIWTNSENVDAGDFPTDLIDADLLGGQPPSFYKTIVDDVTQEPWVIGISNGKLYAARYTAQN